MPTYEYHCDSCDRNFDVVQSFHDDPLVACPTCGSPVRKVFGNVGIVFKGSGFYKTDSRTTAGAKSGDGAGSPDKGADGGAKDGAGSEPKDRGSGDGAAPTAPKKDPSTPAPAATASSSGSGTSGNGSRTTKESTPA